MSKRKTTTASTTPAAPTTPDTGRGVIFFNVDGTCGGYVNTPDGERHTVRGRYDEQGNVSVSASGVSISYRKGHQAKPTHPVGRGKLITSDGEVESLSVWRVEKDGRVFHGLSTSEMAPTTNAPF